MAISPPSDIVSDVARAADPGRYQIATQRLAVGAGPADGASFDNEVKSIGARGLLAAGGDAYAMRTSLRNDAGSAAADKSKTAYQDFEAFVLQSFVESMLPKDAENSYGKGTAGSVWRSMMAEQIGRQISRAGGVGIARTLLASQSLSHQPTTPEPPPAAAVDRNKI